MATLILLRRSADWEPLFCGESKIHGGCLFESCVSFKNRTFEGTNFHPRIHDPCASKPRNFWLSNIHAYIVAKILQGKWIQSWKIWFQFTRIYSIFVSPKNQIFKFSSLLRTFCTNNFTWKIFYEYIETKIISTFLRTFSVQKIKNSFVVLITWLTCTKTFAYVHIYIYILYWKR